MDFETQIIVIKIAPGAKPEARVETLPDVEFSFSDEAVDFLLENSYLPEDAELDETTFMVNGEDDGDGNGEYDGYYLTFNAGDTRYCVIVKQTLF